MGRSSQINRYKEKVQRRRKIAIFVMLLAFFTILANALFGSSGILVNMQVQSEHRALVDEQEALKRTNQQLLEEIRALQASPRQIEAVGRKEYGFARPGEIVFIFPEDSKKPVESFKVPETQTDSQN